MLIAEACNPAWTSVPLVGFNMASAIAARPNLDVTLVTNARNAADLAGSPLADAADVQFIDTERISGPLYRLGAKLRGGASLGWTTAMALAWPGYVAFEHAVAKRFGPALHRGEFDLIHRLTPLSPALPSPLAGRFDVPFAIGPINGGLPWPKDYPELRSREREWLSPLRGAVRHLPYWKRTFRRADGILTASGSAEAGLPSRCDAVRLRFPENGIDPERFPIADGWTPPAAGQPFTFVSVGRLVPLKAFDVVLEALAKLDDDSRLVLIGDGPERKPLLALASRLGVAERVAFRGWMDQHEVARDLAAAQAFVFPSLREFGGGVVLEAMAAGLPSVVVNYGGPGELVSDATGIRVPMAARAELVSSVAEAMQTLRTKPDVAAAMGTAAAAEVRTRHTWTAKAARIAAFYADVLRQAGRPLPSGFPAVPDPHLATPEPIASPCP